MLETFLTTCDELAPIIGTSRGKSPRYIGDLDDLPIDRRFEVCKIAALLTVASELAALRRRDTD
jgi:hypothetical protein